jgi:hypothetical protein
MPFSYWSQCTRPIYVTRDVGSPDVTESRVKLDATWKIIGHPAVFDVASKKPRNSDGWHG